MDDPFPVVSPSKEEHHHAAFPLIKATPGTPPITNEHVNEAIAKMDEEEAEYYARFTRTNPTNYC